MEYKVGRMKKRKKSGRNESKQQKKETNQRRIEERKGEEIRRVESMNYVIWRNE